MIGGRLYTIASKCHATRNDIVHVSSSFNFAKIASARGTVRARIVNDIVDEIVTCGRGFRAPIFSRKCDRMLAILLVGSEFPIG